MPFERKAYAFGYSGVDLNAAVDQMPPGRCPICTNWREEIDNVLSPRPGQGAGSAALIAAQTPLHSVKRLDDSSSGTTSSILIAGAGTHIGTISTDLATVVDKDNSYSGDPLSMVTFRPNQSVKKWLYAADRSRMHKFDVAGNVKQIGLPPPAGPPFAVIGQPRYKVVDEFDTFGPSPWTNGGTASAPVTNTRVDDATRTIGQILYDRDSAGTIGTTGWCSIQPAAGGAAPMRNVGRGMRLEVNTGGGTVETVTVQDVFRGSAQVTIFNAMPEANYPGYAWVQIQAPVDDIDVNSLVLLNTGTATPEYVRVLAVEKSIDNMTAFRAWCVNDPLGPVFGINAQAMPSFRVWTVGNHANAETLKSISTEFDVTVGTGFVTRTLVIDLSSIDSSTPTRPDDEMHVSVFVDKPDLVSEIKLYLDVDGTSSNFTDNYMLHTLRSNDFIPVTKDTQTEIDNARTRTQRDAVEKGLTGDRFDDRAGRIFLRDPVLDPVDPVTMDPVTGAPTDRSTQTDAGQNQYSEIRFRISELLTPDIGRIGADYSRGLRDVGALKVAVIATGTVKIRLDSWWIGGGYGPDVTGDRPFIYRYRGRDSSTGVVGNFSPPMRGGVSPYRQLVNVSLAQHPSSECDKLDVERYGGSLLGWYYAGSADNSATPVFADTMSPLDLSSRSEMSDQQNHNFQLWPIRSTPVAGTTHATTSAGPIVNLDTGAISVSTAPGTLVKVNGKSAHVYRVFTTTRFETFESNSGMIPAAAYPVEIPEPTLQAQNLPILAGPFYGFYFAAGDPINPQRLYYSNGYDCDSTADDHFIDIETETIMNVVVYAEDRMIVLTATGAYTIEPSFTLAAAGGNLFAFRRIPDAPGLFARWACCAIAGSAGFSVAGGVAYLASDGIHFSAGGMAEVLTEDLRPIFPHEGNLGVVTNGFYPPNMVAAQEANLRLSYVESELFFDYIDTNSTRRTIVRRVKPHDKPFGWRVYSYSVAAQLHAAEEGRNVRGALMGGIDGKLYRMGRAVADAAGASIVATIQTPSVDGGDPVLRKLIGNWWLDYDTDGAAAITVTPGYDNHSATLTPVSITDATGRVRKPFDIASGEGQFCRNFDLSIATTVTTARPKLYFWQPAWRDREADQSYLRGDDYEMHGRQGATLVRGIYIMADTFAATRSAKLQYTIDDGTKVELVISGINHATMTERFYAVPAGVYMVASRLLPTDANSWELVGYRIEGEPAPPKSDGPTEWIDLKGARFVQGIVPDIDTGGANCDLQVQVDQAAVQTTIQAGLNSGPVNANGRAQLPFSFDVPFITHLIRFIPSIKCRIWGVKIDARPEPEMAYMWRTQQTACGIAHWKMFGDGYLSLRSTDNVRFFIVADGTSYEVTFRDASTNTAGARRRLWFRCPPIKAKSVEFMLQTATTAGRVAAYEKDFALELKEWGSEAAWQMINPLGDTHFDRGADI